MSCSGKEKTMGDGEGGPLKSAQITPYGYTHGLAVSLQAPASDGNLLKGHTAEPPVQQMYTAYPPKQRDQVYIFSCIIP